jgi:hypothetical protein
MHRPGSAICRRGSAFTSPLGCRAAAGLSVDHRPTPIAGHVKGIAVEAARNLVSDTHLQH